MGYIWSPKQSISYIVEITFASAMLMGLGIPLTWRTSRIGRVETLGLSTLEGPGSSFESHLKIFIMGPGPPIPASNIRLNSLRVGRPEGGFFLEECYVVGFVSPHHIVFFQNRMWRHLLIKKCDGELRFSNIERPIQWYIFGEYTFVLRVAPLVFYLSWLDGLIRIY